MLQKLSSHFILPVSVADNASMNLYMYKHVHINTLDGDECDDSPVEPVFTTRASHSPLTFRATVMSVLSKVGL